LVCLGEGYTQQGKYQDAISQYKLAFAAAEGEKRKAIAAVHLGDAYVALNDTENAKQWYVKAIENESEGSDAYNQYKAKLDALK
jgi:predicted negative regulator of RcsB-dependent stress response